MILLKFQPLVYLSFCLLVISDENHFIKKNMPIFSGLDMLELYHLRSFPLLQELSSAGSFKYQTSGLALLSAITSEIIVLEFKCLNVTACFLPIINTQDPTSDNNEYDNSEYDFYKYRDDEDMQYLSEEESSRNSRKRQLNSSLSWDKRSTISYSKYIDSTYWLQSTFLGR